MYLIGTGHYLKKTKTKSKNKKQNKKKQTKNKYKLNNREMKKAEEECDFGVDIDDIFKADNYIFSNVSIAQSAGAVEYTDGTSAVE